MKTNLIFFFLLLSNLSGFAQFTVKGVVISEGKPYNDAKIIFVDPDSKKVGSFVDSNGCFDFIFQKTGKYIINTKQSSWGYGKSNDTIFLSKDTNLIITLSFPLAYTQPCRKFSKQNNFFINIPADEWGIHQFEKSTQTSKKMKLPEILNNTALLTMRIWNEGAFQGGGGTLYEISETKNGKWSLKIINYKSNYYEILQLDSVTEKYANDSDVYIYGADYEVISQKCIDDFSEKWFIENGIDYLNRYVKSEDYCITLSSKDNPIIMDGEIFLVELKYKSNYSVAFFDNPEITGKYDQIDSFVKIMEILEKRTQNQNR